MKVEVLQETFIPPNKYAEGSIIEYLGPWGPQFKALDDQAKAAEAEYFSRRPDATLDPTKDLPKTTGAGAPGGPAVEGEFVRPSASIIRAPTTVGVDAQSSGNPGLAAESGNPADFGQQILDKIKDDPNFAAALLAAVSQQQAPGGTRVVTPDLEPSGDMPGRGAGAETVSIEEAQKQAAQTAAPLIQPVTGAGKSAAADEANLASAKAGGAQTEGKPST